jgi:hypothetical protein
MHILCNNYIVCIEYNLEQAAYKLGYCVIIVSDRWNGHNAWLQKRNIQASWIQVEQHNSVENKLCGSIQEITCSL